MIVESLSNLWCITTGMPRDREVDLFVDGALMEVVHQRRSQVKRRRSRSAYWSLKATSKRAHRIFYSTNPLEFSAQKVLRTRCPTAPTLTRCARPTTCGSQASAAGAVRATRNLRSQAHHDQGRSDDLRGAF